MLSTTTNETMRTMTILINDLKDALHQHTETEGFTDTSRTQ